jgi:formylglycine-generating enzyme
MKRSVAGATVLGAALALVTACTALVGYTEITAAEDAGAPHADAQRRDSGSDARPTDATSGHGDSVGVACQTGNLQCNGTQPLICDNMTWQDYGPPCPSACSAGQCLSCNPGAIQCAGQQPQKCNTAGVWVANGTCEDKTCIAGTCTGECAQGQARCDGQQPQSCSATGTWNNPGTPCASTETCLNGSCSGACGPDEKRCNGSQPQGCSDAGTWLNSGAACAGGTATPYCVGSACATKPPSCVDGGVGAGDNCGASGTEDCCGSFEVTGGMFTRDDNEDYPATISQFRLDAYEVTVGRFRKFVAAVVAGWVPPTGIGLHLHLNGGLGLRNSGTNGGYETGWQAQWNTELTTTLSAWNSDLTCGGVDAGVQTWTLAAGPKDDKPVDCADWFEAYAFCIWDGGFLPSEAEFNYAFMDGNAERTYPWGDTPQPGANAALAVYSCEYGDAGFECSPGRDVAPVGSVVAGNGAFSQSDLAGNLDEWELDWYETTYTSLDCVDCADTTDNSAIDRVFRGGAYNSQQFQIEASYRYGATPTTRAAAYGFRCARTP